jgi:sulfate-transporting ATPase
MRRARAGLARSFQSLELFEDSTVFENLSVAADPQDLRSYVFDLVWPINPPFPPEVVRAVREFQLDQDLHRDVKDLSYGKRRLLAIARAVAMHPSVLLLDEPAAGLSSTESAELSRVVRRLADNWGMAVLVVEHDMNFVMGVCDQVVVLDFGKLIASGSPEQVSSDPAVIAAYLGDETDDEQDAGTDDEPASSPASVAGGAS